MDNMMQVFDSERFGQVRVVMRESEPWFAAVDVCKALDVSNPTMALNRLDSDEKMTLSSTDGHSGQRGGAQSMSWVNEPGLYTLVLGSRKPEAKAFKRWITHEVIPSLRKHGAYVVGQDNMDESELIAKALIAAKSVLDERERRLREAQEQNAVMLPKAEYYDALADRNLLTNLRDTAKELGLGQKEFVQKLTDDGFMYRDGKGQLKPYIQYVDKYFAIKDSFNPATNWVGTQTLITMDGKDYFRRRYACAS